MDDTPQRINSYLDSLQWDGVCRVFNWMHEYLGAEGNHCGTGIDFLYGAVARARKPGCHVPVIPVLQAPQGARKSRAIRALAGEFFAEFSPEIDGALSLQQSWISEICEIEDVTRRHYIRMKQFLARSSDTVRMPYGREAEALPRHNVFIGTTNSPDFLSSEDGSRRFKLIRCGTIDVERLAADRDQLWAEAAARFATHVPHIVETPQNTGGIIV